MVKVEEMSAEELGRLERYDKLVKLANEYLGQHFDINGILSPTTMGFTHKNARAEEIRNSSFSLSLLRNEIFVYSQNNLEAAVGLAEMYEKNGENEFRVIKKYISKT